MMTLDLNHSRAGSLLADAVSHRPPRLDLAALAVATSEYPELACEPVLDRLDLLAQRVLAHKGTSWKAADQAAALRTVLGGEERLGGSPEAYRHAQSSYLNDVLERKVGIPISLSVVWLEVARRAEIPLYGISFPGHFLVGLGKGAQRLVLDPFSAGKQLSTDELAALLEKTAPGTRLEEGLLAQASVQAIAWRMLTNLKNLHLGTGDHLRALHVEDLLLTLAPDHPGELRSRAALLSAIGAYKAALKDLDKVLDQGPAPDAAVLQQAAKALRRRLSFVH
jgi:regulator of sirC expression with transglutaminase-like and TPR domain